MRRVDVRRRRRLLDDFFKVDEAELSFECFDGSMTPPVRRLVFERGDSVAAVVFDRDAKKSGGQETQVPSEMSDDAVRALWLKRIEPRPEEFLRARFAYQLQATP